MPTKYSQNQKTIGDVIELLSDLFEIKTNNNIDIEIATNPKSSSIQVSFY